jgi:hypothetical protein
MMEKNRNYKYFDDMVLNKLFESKEGEMMTEAYYMTMTINNCLYSPYSSQIMELMMG